MLSKLLKCVCMGGGEVVGGEWGGEGRVCVGGGRCGVVREEGGGAYQASLILWSCYSESRSQPVTVIG